MKSRDHNSSDAVRMLLCMLEDAELDLALDLSHDKSTIEELYSRNGMVFLLQMLDDQYSLLLTAFTAELVDLSTLPIKW